MLTYNKPISEDTFFLIFRQVDSNNDGYISYYEMHQFLAMQLRHEHSPDEIQMITQHIMYELDQNRDGKISCEEFRKVNKLSFDP